jgi:uncharacterized C2H2 Zn-finger protein
MMEDIDAIPLMCSKCQMTFEKESDYLQHYKVKHEPDSAKSI